MVRYQIAGRDVKNPAVLDVMARVPRHLFLPEHLRPQAYDDGPLPIGDDQTISQPFIVASMTEMLNPDKSKSVLEVGTGSGYQTAVLAELFGRVVTVEYFPALAGEARLVLENLGYENIEYRAGNALEVIGGTDIFEAIMVTAAPAEIPEKLISALGSGGRMIIPVGKGQQYLKLVEKDFDAGLKIKTLYAVRFVPLLAD